ncbi:MAG: putative DNA binding domain-containing protein [Prevotella sp.]|nr:putative DNA binding domain-containing protein [Prevotella sp.]
MKENILYDRKSLRSVLGKTANFKELAKDCVAFSNAECGVIDIGIEDKEDLPPDGQIIPEGLTTTIVNQIRSLTEAVTVTPEICKANNGAQYIKLHVKRNPNAVSATSSGRFFIRIGDSSVPVGPDDIARLFEDKSNKSWEITPTNYNWQDADKEKLNGLLQRIKTSDRVSASLKQKDTKELLDYFFLTEENDNLTNLGVLFIGTQQQRGRLLNAPVIQCIKYDQYGEKVNKWLWDDYTKNPAEMISELWETIPEWKESTEISDGMFRRNIPAYPEKVIRELAANALVHRQYTVKGDIFINIYPDHLEFKNPGRLPLGVTVENILHTTKKRNEHMANLFYVLHLMEREGSGYDMMYETLLANGKVVPKVTEGEDWVEVRIERNIISQEMIKVMDYADQKYACKQKQLICLGLITLHESVTGTQLIELLNLKDSKYLRSWLQPLIDKRLVIATGEKTKAKEYRVNDKILKDSQYRGRTSLKRIEDYRIRELIIEDLKIYKEASSVEIRTRIGNEIPAKKIWKQINKLIAEGKIIAKGENRWRKYALIESPQMSLFPKSEE